MYQSSVEEMRRRERERVMMQEGVELWREQKKIKQDNILKDKREVRQLLEKYWPWGKPGGGAANGCFVGLKNVHLEGMFAEEDMKKARRHVGTIKFGRPGGGAPHISQSGRRQIRFREDPALRFQWCEDLRRTVDNTLRYKTPREEQYKYKKQLDELVEERKKIKEAEIKKDLEWERKLGWTNDTVIKNIRNAKLSQLRKPYSIKTGLNQITPLQPITQDVKPTEKAKLLLSPPVKNTAELKSIDKKVQSINSGIELVPLLVKKKRNIKVGLSTTDVTRGDSLPIRLRVGEPEYLHELTKQVNYRDQQLKVNRAEEVESCRRHFETWGSLWGRPGHGAPRGDTHKSRLDLMWLYPTPVPQTVH